MGRTRAIIFDVGGTLIYPFDPVGETYARFTKAHGVTIAAEAATTAISPGDENLRSPWAKDGVPNNGDDRA